MASKYTSKCRRNLWFIRILDLLLLLTPIIVYIVMALASEGVIVQEKIAVVSTVMIAVVLTMFNIIAQKHLRCPIWIILIGLFAAMKEILMPLVVLLAASSVLDELVFSPLISYLKTKLIASKTIDARMKKE